MEPLRRDVWFSFSCQLSSSVNVCQLSVALKDRGKGTVELILNMDYKWTASIINSSGGLRHARSEVSQQTSSGWMKTFMISRRRIDVSCSDIHDPQRINSNHKQEF